MWEVTIETLLDQQLVDFFLLLRKEEAVVLILKVWVTVYSKEVNGGRLAMLLFNDHQFNIARQEVARSGQQDRLR